MRCVPFTTALKTLRLRGKGFDLPYGWWARQPLTPGRRFHTLIRFHAASRRDFPLASPRHPLYNQAVDGGED